MNIIPIFSQVNWRPVLWGLGLQFSLGVIILRWDKGYLAFKFMGEMVQRFLEFTDEGSKFVFGESGLEQHPVAFKVQIIHGNNWGLKLQRI